MPHFDHSVPFGPFCALLLAMTLKHFVADFLLQTNWMARGKERSHGWAAPLALHVACHTVLTLAIVVVVSPRLWWLAVAEFFVHAAIDRAKSIVSQRAKLNTGMASFWWLLGFDQFLHQITNIALAAAFFVI